jgi:hypothetical protein
MALKPTFNEAISLQVKTRQEKLNLANNLDDENIVYRNNRYPFIRLTSGIDIAPSKNPKDPGNTLLRSIGLEKIVTPGNDLAKRYKLFSTRFTKNIGTDINGDTIFKEEFTSNIGYSVSYATSYGFTSDPKYGLTPPPGIESADIKTLNKGGVRTAEVKIIAHNIIQFNIISLLYLQLRYCMLLEWGHNIYYDNKGKFQNNSIDLSNKFLNKETVPSLLTEIGNKQFESCGNYDALLGVVKNFTWNLKSDGSYEISLDLISVGDIAESIQMNTALSYKDGNISDSAWLLPATYNRSSLDRILAKIQYDIIQTEAAGSGSPPLDNASIKTGTGVDYSFTKTPNTTSTPPEVFEDNTEACSITFASLENSDTNTPTPSTQYYIKLGALLRIIESFLLEYNTSVSPSYPTVFLDYDYDDNFCFILNDSISSDPRKCLIPLTKKSANAGKIYKYITYDVKARFKYIEGKEDFNTHIKAPDRWKFQGWTKIIGSKTYTDVLDPDSTGQITSTDKVYLTYSKLNGGVMQMFAKDITDGDPEKFKYPGTDLFPVSHGLPLTPDVGAFFNETILAAEAGNKMKVYLNNPDIIDFNSLGILDKLDLRFRTTDVNKGKLMHVLLNIDFIHSVIEESFSDSDSGHISLTDFLEKILEGIQESLGYINDFTVSYNSYNNSLRILDNTYLANLYNKIDPTIFNISYSTNTEGSFIRDYSLKSEVFSKVGNALMAGSQQNGNNGVTNGNLFSELYKGTTDRILKTKRNNNVSVTSNSAKETLKTLFNTYQDYRFKLVETRGSLSTSDIDGFKASIKDYYRFDIGQLIKSKNSDVVGDRLIPLNLQLTMDGLSGMDIHQIFNINSRLLPSDYVGKVSFVIRELTHKISDEGWITNVGSLSIINKSSATADAVSVVEEEAIEEEEFTINVETVVIASSAASFRARLVDIAKQEEAYWRSQGWDANADQTSVPARERIVAMGNVWGRSSTEISWKSNAWSGLTISYFVKTADTGTTSAGFLYSYLHADYTYKGRQNMLNNTGYFKSYTPEEVKNAGSKIELGDLVCYPRERPSTVENSNYPSHCNVVVEITPSVARTIGGNLGETLKYDQADVPLDATGNIDNASRKSWITYPYHAVIKWTVPD